MTYDEIVKKAVDVLVQPLEDALSNAICLLALREFFIHQTFSYEYFGDTRNFNNIVFQTSVKLTMDLRENMKSLSNEMLEQFQHIFNDALTVRKDLTMRIIEEEEK